MISDHLQRPPTIGTGAASLGVVLLLLLSLLTGACAHKEGRRYAAAIAAKGGLMPVEFPTGLCPLVGWLRDGGLGPLVVYLEGDGLAYITRSRPSSNPTPLNPVALRLAAADPSPRVLYLGRPCQYITPSDVCNPWLWTCGRFSPPVIAAVNEAIDQAVASMGNQGVVLVGFSGGGAVAALAAVQRHDVLALVTVAGNMDHEVWTDHHRVTPLHGSLNPANVALQLNRMPQIHFVGDRDRVIPRIVTESFIRRLGSNHLARLEIVPGVDHTRCWERHWPELRKLLESVVAVEASPVDLP